MAYNVYINRRHGCAAARADAGINAFEEALEECCLGLRSAESSNFCSGVRRMRLAACDCTRALNSIRHALGCEASGHELRGLSRCCDGLRDIRRGCSEVDCGNIRDGIEDCEAGLSSCQQGLDMLKNAP